MNQPCVRSGPGRADQSPRTLRAVAGQDSVGAAGGEVLIGLARLAEPWAVRVAATLRLADLAADGGTGLEALATRAGADPEGPGLPAALPCRPGRVRGAGSGGVRRQRCGPVAARGASGPAPALAGSGRSRRGDGPGLCRAARDRAQRKGRLPDPVRPRPVGGPGRRSPPRRLVRLAHAGALRRAGRRRGGWLPVGRQESGGRRGRRNRDPAGTHLECASSAAGHPGRSGGRFAEVAKVLKDAGVASRCRPVVADFFGPSPPGPTYTRCGTSSTTGPTNQPSPSCPDAPRPPGQTGESLSSSGWSPATATSKN